MPRRSILIPATVAAVALFCLAAGHRVSADPTDAFSSGAITRGLPTARATAGSPHWAQFKVSVTTDKPRYRIGDLMDIRVRAARDCYLIVYYTSADGKKAIICPSPFAPADRVRAGVPFHLLDKQGRKLQQQGPVGSETVQVLATTEPIDVTKLKGIKLPPAAPAHPPAADHPAPTHAQAVAPAQAGSTTGPAVVKKPAKPAAAKPAAAKPAAAKPAKSTAASAKARPGAVAMAPADGRPAWNTPAAGMSTIEVTHPDEFVDDATRAIRTRVAARSRSLGSRRPGSHPQDSCFGLGSARYQVIK